MYRATNDIMLPTTITGSLPLPSWYTENVRKELGSPQAECLATDERYSLVVPTK